MVVSTVGACARAGAHARFLPMPQRNPHARFLPRPARLLVLAGLVALAAPTQAAPPTDPADHAAIDPIAQLLHEKGLSPARLADAPRALARRAGGAASDLVVSALGFLGIAYRRGGNSADEGFDCSGFTRHVFEHSLGLILPRRADEQARLPGLLAIRLDQLEPGDLVFFDTMRRAFSHVGIYVGDGRFIHAPRSGAHIRLEDMRGPYWARRFNGARRAPAAAASDSAVPPDTPADRTLQP